MKEVAEVEEKIKDSDNLDRRGPLPQPHALSKTATVSISAVCGNMSNG